MGLLAQSGLGAETERQTEALELLKKAAEALGGMDALKKHQNIKRVVSIHHADLNGKQIELVGYFHPDRRCIDFIYSKEPPLKRRVVTLKDDVWGYDEGTGKCLNLDKDEMEMNAVNTSIIRLSDVYAISTDTTISLKVSDPSIIETIQCPGITATFSAKGRVSCLMNFNPTTKLPVRVISSVDGKVFETRVFISYERVEGANVTSEIEHYKDGKLVYRQKLLEAKLLGAYDDEMFKKPKP